MKKKLICLLLTVLLAVTLLPLGALAAEKEDVSREIAVVFDNSGSMYMMGGDLWCRATYAVEVFAAMMNEGDTLKVFPMWEVQTSKGAYNYENNQPLVVQSVADIAEIHEMYTEWAGGTPIESIDAAYASLEASSVDEKWLVVITDGGTFHKGGADLGGRTVSELTALLGDYSTRADDIFVQYLAIGMGASTPDLPETEHYRPIRAANSSEIIPKLTAACNNIFGRDTLPAANLNGQQLTFDVTMKKLIVFAQGTGASVGGLSGAGGEVKEVANTRYEATYSDKGCGNYAGEFGVDTSLGGVVVTYGAAAAGSYQLDYTGSDVAVYYEPDVALRARVIGPDGQEVDGSDPNWQLITGEYTVYYEMYDRVTGQTTESALLGNVQYDASVTVGGSSQVLGSGDTVSVQEGDTLEFDIVATYLSGYRAAFGSDDYFVYGQNLKGAAPKVAGSLVLQLTGGAEKYKNADFDANAVYLVTGTYDGVPLTAEELERLQLTLDAPAGVAGTFTPQADGVQLALTLTGQVAEGPQTFTVNGLLTHENTDDATASVTGGFELAADDLKLELSCEDNYFVVGQLESYEPFVLDISCNGQPVDDAALAQLAANLQVELKGSNVQYTVTPVPGASQLTIALRHAGAAADTETGRCSLKVTTSMTDAAGGQLTGSDKMSFTLSTMPLWLKWLIAIAIIALIVLLIWLYMSMKVLPRTLTFSDAEFRVKGRLIEDDPTIRSANGRGKKTVAFSIMSPSADGYPEVDNYGVTLRVSAVSERRVKSAKRKVGIEDIQFSNPDSVKSAMIGGHMFEKDRKSGELLADGHQPGEEVKYGKLSNNTDCSIDCVFESANGTRTRATFSFKVRFK